MTYHWHEAFLRVERGEASPEVTLEDGRAAVAMGLAAQQSAATARAARGRCPPRHQARHGAQNPVDMEAESDNFDVINSGSELMIEVRTYGCSGYSQQL
jgi:hypothetical protein